MDKDIKQALKKSLLLSAGLFVLGKKKIEEFAKSLEENGLNKEEAEKVAQDVLNQAKEHTDAFMKRVTDEIKEKNIFATKEDIQKLEAMIKNQKKDN